MKNWTDFKVGEKYYCPRHDKGGKFYVCVGMTLQGRPIFQSTVSARVLKATDFSGGENPSDWAVFREPREWCIVILKDGRKTIWEHEVAARKYYYKGEYEYVTVREVVE